LALHRANYNGLNVGIVGTQYISPLDYEHIRDFIRDVYNTQSAAHTGDGYLGYVLLIGDAYYDNTTEMLPAAYPDYYDQYYEQASDHYYTCLTQIEGGSYDDYPDVMIGRLSVGNETELSNAVSKIIDYETTYASGDWRNNMFLTNGSADLNSESNSAFTDIVENVIPSGYDVSYLYRDGTCTVPSTKAVIYHKPDADKAHDTIVSLINQGQWIVNYEGHGDQLGWEYPRLLDTSDLTSNLTNVGKLPFILSIACNTGRFDNQWSVDCMAEQFVNHAGNGAVAFLGSSRGSDTMGAFGKVDKFIYQAIFDHRAYLAGEAVLECKLRPELLTKYRRQYNLFGDPALNLKPQEVIHYVAGNITQNTVWQAGLYYVVGDVTVNNGVTLTIQPGAVIKFYANTRLTVNGKLTAIGNEDTPIIFRSIRPSYNKGLWYGIVFTSSADNSSTIQYATIKNAEYGIYLSPGRKPAISYNTISFNTYGIYGNSPGSTNITHNTIQFNKYGVYTWYPENINVSDNVMGGNTYGIDEIYCRR